MYTYIYFWDERLEHFDARQKHTDTALLVTFNRSLAVPVGDHWDCWVASNTALEVEAPAVDPCGCLRTPRVQGHAVHRSHETAWQAS